eukprot:Rmarinus@m.9463
MEKTDEIYDFVYQIYAARCKDIGQSLKRDERKAFVEPLIPLLKEGVLKIRNGRLGVNSGVTITKVLKYREDIKKLDLYGNHLRDLGALSVVELLRVSPHITTVNIGANELTATCVPELANFLEQSKSLTYLELGTHHSDIHCNKIDADGGKAIADAMGHNTTLTYLGLTRNPMGAGSTLAIEAFSRMVRRNNTLRVLRLGATGITTEGAMDLLQAVGKNRALRQLDLRDNNLGPDSGASIGKCLRRSQSLESIDLSYCRLYDRGLYPVCAALAQHARHMKTLLIRGNHISDRGAGVLADALAENATLTSVNVADNNISAEGLHEIVYSLLSNERSSVSHLTLSKNPLKEDGAEHIAALITESPTLTYLDLGECKIPDEGAGVLAEALAQTSNLSTLHIPHNFLTQGSGDVLCSALEVNSSLTAMDISGNSLPHMEVSRIKKLLKKNADMAKLEGPRKLLQRIHVLQFEADKLPLVEAEYRHEQMLKAHAKKSVEDDLNEVETVKMEAKQSRKEYQEKIDGETKLAQSTNFQIEAKHEEMLQFEKEQQMKIADLQSDVEKIQMANAALQQKLEHEQKTIDNTKLLHKDKIREKMEQKQEIQKLQQETMRKVTEAGKDLALLREIRNKQQEEESAKETPKEAPKDALKKKPKAKR